MRRHQSGVVDGHHLRNNPRPDPPRAHHRPRRDGVADQTALQALRSRTFDQAGSPLANHLRRWILVDVARRPRQRLAPVRQNLVPCEKTPKGRTWLQNPARSSWSPRKDPSHGRPSPRDGHPWTVVPYQPLRPSLPQWSYPSWCGSQPDSENKHAPFCQSYPGDSVRSSSRACLSHQHPPHQDRPPVDQSRDMRRTSTSKGSSTPPRPWRSSWILFYTR